MPNIILILNAVYENVKLNLEKQYLEKDIEDLKNNSDKIIRREKTSEAWFVKKI